MSSEEADSLMKRASELLNLKSHSVTERKTGEKVVMQGPVDLELHLARDGRYYAVDLARLFPPQKPLPGVKGCFLYKLFRPEFLKNYPKSISSDCYSYWGREDPDNNKEADEATAYLLDILIPQLLQSGDLNNSSIEDMKSILHKWGVNMRFCSVLYFQSDNPILMKNFAIQVNCVNI